LTMPSGERDVGHILTTECGLRLPPGLLADFASVLRTSGKAGPDVISAGPLRDIFEHEYLVCEPVAILLLRCTARNTWTLPVRAGLRLRREVLTRKLCADPAVLCAERLRTLGIEVSILDRYSHRIVPGRRTAVYVRCMAGSPVWGVGISDDDLGASRRAVLSAVGRSRRTPLPLGEDVRPS